MSRLRKPVSTVAPRKLSSEPTDYVPQHPMAAFRHVESPEPQPDHLEQYAEVRPFEDADWTPKAVRSTDHKHTDDANLTKIHEGQTDTDVVAAKLEAQEEKAC